MWDAVTGASNEIVGGIVVAGLSGLLGWAYKRYKALKEEFARTEQEIERMKEEKSRICATKEEHERLRAELHRKDEELNQARANAQEDALRIKKLWEQVSDAEVQHEADTRRIETLQNQLETAQAELQRKDEALRQAEAKSQEDSRQGYLFDGIYPFETIPAELELGKAKERIPPMSDAKFIELCASGDVRKVEKAIMNSANVNVKGYLGGTGLMVAGNTRTASLLRKYGAK